MTTQCKLGDATLTKGSTPTAIPGVTVVSPQQAKCLTDRYADSVLVIGAMDDTSQLPDAYPVPILGYDKEDAEFTKQIASSFMPLTGGNKARPILIYCHHASCQFSANGAQHLVNMGYTRVYWLRDGTKGWQQAGYKFAAEPRLAPGQTKSFAFLKRAGGYTFDCFGAESLGACEQKMSLEYSSYTAPDVKTGDKPIILGELLNTVAVYAGYLRTGGRDGKQPKDLKKSVGLAGDGMTILREAYAGGFYPNAYADNLKLQQEATLAYFEAGRPAEAQAALREARAVADKSFATLGTARTDTKKKNAVLSTMIGAEKLEREVAGLAGGRAAELYKTGKASEAIKYKDLAQPAFGRAAAWIARNDKEGVSGFAEQSAPQRLATLKLAQGDMLLAAGDKTGATAAYRTARATSCSYVSDKTVAEAKGSGVTDVFQYSFLRDCKRAEMGEMKATGALDQKVREMTEAMMRQQYALMGLDYDKVKKGAK